jgi:uncharacterized protein involved in exopolysaccharide biosynthesis
VSRHARLSRSHGIVLGRCDVSDNTQVVRAEDRARLAKIEEDLRELQSPGHVRDGSESKRIAELEEERSQLRDEIEQLETHYPDWRPDV